MLNVKIYYIVAVFSERCCKVTGGEDRMYIRGTVTISIMSQSFMYTQPNVSQHTCYYPPFEQHAWDQPPPSTDPVASSWMPGSRPQVPQTSEAANLAGVMGQLITTGGYYVTSYRIHLLLIFLNYLTNLDAIEQLNNYIPLEQYKLDGLLASPDLETLPWSHGEANPSGIPLAYHPPQMLTITDTRKSPSRLRLALTGQICPQSRMSMTDSAHCRKSARQDHSHHRAQ